MTDTAGISVDGVIPLAAMVNHHLYTGTGRNFNVAVWFGGAFYGLRTKFHDTFVDREYHWEADGTFRPTRHVCDLQERLTPGCYFMTEWRLSNVLYDMLFTAERLLAALEKTHE